MQRALVAMNGVSQRLGAGPQVVCSHACGHSARGARPLPFRLTRSRHARGNRRAATRASPPTNFGGDSRSPWPAARSRGAPPARCASLRRPRLRPWPRRRSKWMPGVGSDGAHFGCVWGIRSGEVLRVCRCLQTSGRRPGSRGGRLEASWPPLPHFPGTTSLVLPPRSTALIPREARVDGAPRISAVSVAMWAQASACAPSAAKVARHKKAWSISACLATA